MPIIGVMCPDQLPTAHNGIVTRWTTWASDVGIHQLAVALLDDQWEPIYDASAMLGPFDDVQAVADALYSDAMDWLARWGVQQRLELG